MLDTSALNQDFALASNQHVSTAKSALWADYVVDVMGPKGLPILFKGILPADLSDSDSLSLNGKPISYPYFVQPGQWFNNDTCLTFYRNMQSITPNMVDVGATAAQMALKKRNIMELRLLTLPKAALILRSIARINAKLARNKTPRIMDLKKNSGHLAITYHEGMYHTAASTDYYRGFLCGCLDFLGFRDVRSTVLFDHMDNVKQGETEILFEWEEKSFPEKFKIRALEKHLSRRETELVRLLSEGFTLQEISYLTDITYETVKFHLANARKKLNCRTREELVAKFITQSLGG
ncbi:helix-turn-helix transcriptional regulator [Kordiimonas lipolytica]|uniref:Helix-turn-helix transcriptional regulator n=1 Tax=Kordiimonas lipolytica TaxID=1662421 RepID=A0ABV8UCP4_9PROT|nr:helix-turn-helix transcriptional regulator [Kordiimonas lipolytica]